MAPNQLSPDELVQHATYLFGAEWRDALAAALGMSRRSLVITLASGEEIPADMALSVVRLLEQRLDEMQREQNALRERIRTLRDHSQNLSVAATQPRGQLMRAV